MTLDEVSLLLIGATATSRRRFSIRLFGAFPMRVVTTRPKTSSGMFAVGPDMAKILGVEALRKASLNSV
jgi:hypothetical protein